MSIGVRVWSRGMCREIKLRERRAGIYFVMVWERMLKEFDITKDDNHFKPEIVHFVCLFAMRIAKKYTKINP